jgi:hypothetical protein
MTYPAQPQYPPGYSPTAYPAPPQGGYPAAVAQAAPAPNGADPFSDPSGGGAAGPHLRNLDGCTVIVKPNRVDESAQFKGQSRPTAYYDMVVVDGGTRTFGENLDTGSPATHRFTAPAYFRNVMGGSVAVVDICRNNPGGLVVGVVQRGTQGNRPWLVTKTHVDVNGNDRPDGDARRAAARDLWFRIQSGEVGVTTPELLAPGTGAPAQAYVNYANASAHPAGQPQPALQYPGQPVVYQPASAQQPVSSAPVAGPAELPPPPGWDAQSWGNFPPEAKAGIWQQINAAPLQPPGQPAPPTPAAGQPTGW